MTLTAVRSVTVQEMNVGSIRDANASMSTSSCTHRGRERVKTDLTLNALRHYYHDALSDARQ
eukprot:1972640-Rhodomonas_salina.2